MKRFLFLILLLTGQFAFGQSKDTTFGKPIFWYHVSDPWAMFMGAEGPVFILYNSGKILFWKNGAYRLTQIDEQEKEELISELDLNDTLFRKSRNFDATNPDPNSNLIGATDNPTYTISLNFDTLIRISVYGYINSKEYRKRFPQKFLSVHDFILNFDDDKEIKWIPEKIEVMLSDYSNSPDISIKQPTGWPDMNSPDARKSAGYATSIFIDKKYFGQLVKMIKQRREKQAFEINGKKYFIGYRFPIPDLY